MGCNFSAPLELEVSGNLTCVTFKYLTLITASAAAAVKFDFSCPNLSKLV